MVPAMIYLLRMPTNIVIGTSIFQIIFITAIVTILHASFGPIRSTWFWRSSSRPAA